MKYNMLWLALGLLLASLFAAPAHAGIKANFICTFEHPGVDTSVGSPGMEWVVEERQRDGSWLEVAKGPKSPILYERQNVDFGTYTVRVFVRLDPPIPRDVASDTSLPATETIIPGKPVKPFVKADRGINGAIAADPAATGFAAPAPSMAPATVRATAPAKSSTPVKK